MLSAEDLAALTARGIPRSFPRGQALFHVGHVPDRVLLLRKGRVKDGGSGRDRLDGGPGQDVLEARDGGPDTVDCGGGNDFAASDVVDGLMGCEEARHGALKATLRDTAVVRTVSGRVTIRFPGSMRFVPLTGALQIPLGSEIDATDDFVRLTTARDRSGATQAATFYEGRFFVRQGSGPEPVTELRLSGGDFSRCGFAADGGGQRLWAARAGAAASTARAGAGARARCAGRRG